ncbi:hypothetical protein MSAN_01031800 [Mycena sanguinolenta]|uniref:SAP domain-containing protein n=1 Tax=Mycena sanguinolenta TaxID=230812 RepID=A0A8H6YTS4_9AGAR|nr:hypothetical protein MSAN_01031800 [Mycena sanguinolenta]
MSPSLASSIVAAVLDAVSVTGTAARAINLQILDLLDNSPRPLVYTVLAFLCLLPVLDLCAAAAWKYREGTVPAMEDNVIPQAVAAAGQEILPFPTKAGGTEQRTLTGKKLDELKDMCRDYGLFVSGNKSVLLDRLRVFSKKFCDDPTSCDPTHVRRRAHKGPRDGPKKSQPKQSAARRAAVIDTERVTERSKDTRTTDEIEDLLSWADRTRARLPYKPAQKNSPVPSAFQVASPPDRSLHDRMQELENRIAAITTLGAPGVGQWTSDASAVFTPAEYVVYDHTFESLHNFSDINLSFNPPGAAAWSPLSISDNLHITGSSTHPTAPSQSVNATVPTAPSCSSNASPTTASKASRSIHLGDGTAVTINDVSRITVPATSFAANIERLNQMWDDTSTHWKNDSVITIDNHAIALIYWPQIFKKTGLWSAHKSNWTEWKFLVERYRQGTPDEFWSTFRSDGGGKMSYTAICAALRKERKGGDKELAAKAREEYGDEFKVKFSYWDSKTNTQKVMSKASSIAKEYKRLKGL